MHFEKFLDDNGIKVAWLAKRTGINKVTLYNIVNGKISPSKAVYKKLSDVLHLTAGDAPYLDQVLYDLNPGKEELAYKNLCNYLLFNEVDIFNQGIALDTYDIKTKEELSYSQLVEKIAEEFDDSAVLHFANYNNLPIIQAIKKRIGDFKGKIRNSFYFYHNDPIENARNLMCIFELLHYPGLKLYHSDAEKKISHQAFRSILQVRKPANKGLALVDNGFNSALIPVDANMGTLLDMQNESLYLPEHTAKKETNVFNTNLQILESLHVKTLSSLLQNEMCYDLIPNGILEDMAENRMSGENIAEFMSKVKAPDMEFKEMVEYLLKGLDERRELTKIRNIKDFYTVGGLEKFAKTGHFSDHLPGLPDFSIEDRIKIIENTYKRHSDPNDKYQFVLVRGYLENNMYIQLIRKNMVGVAVNNNAHAIICDALNDFCAGLFEYLEEHYKYQGDYGEFFKNLIDIAKKSE